MKTVMIDGGEYQVAVFLNVDNESCSALLCGVEGREWKCFNGLSDANRFLGVAT